MRERIKTIALAAVCLALAGLLVWQLWPETKMVNPIQLDASKIVAVDMISYQGCLDRHEYPITITSEADIRELCDLWNNTWAVRTYPYKNLLGFERVEMPQGGSATVYMVFHTVDGGAFSYHCTYYYFYEYDLATKERGDYYTYGICGLNDALEAFVLSRIEAEVEP